MLSISSASWEPLSAWENCRTSLLMHNEHGYWCVSTPRVIAWLYAIGNMLRLLQDATFQQAINERAFRSNIKRIDLPFYIICGYGETGSLINQGLSQIGIQTVIIDYDTERTNSLELENLTFARDCTHRRYHRIGYSCQCWP